MITLYISDFSNLSVCLCLKSGVGKREVNCFSCIFHYLFPSVQKGEGKQEQSSSKLGQCHTKHTICLQQTLSSRKVSASGVSKLLTLSTSVEIPSCEIKVQALAQQRVSMDCNSRLPKQFTGMGANKNLPYKYNLNIYFF